MRIVFETALINIRHVHDRLRRDQMHARGYLLQLTLFQRANGKPFIQVLFDACQRITIGDGIFLARSSQCASLCQLSLDRLEVRKRQLGVDRFDVVQRIDLAGHMRYIVVLKTTHHVCDRIGFADIGQELIAKTLAFRRARDQSRDVDELHRRRQYLLRIDDAGQHPKRGSGTGTMPTFGSIVQNG